MTEPVDAAARVSPQAQPAATIADPPEGTPAPVPARALPGGKHSLRDALLSWLPGVRGSSS